MDNLLPEEPIQPNQKRKVTITSRVPSNDLQKLKGKAAELGCTLSAFVRQRLLEVIQE